MSSAAAAGEERDVPEAGTQRAGSAAASAPSVAADPSVRALLGCGLLGALVYTLGDFLLYATLGSGAEFHSLPIMASRSREALVAGGVVAPVASLLYVLGARGLQAALRAQGPLLARALFGCWATMFVAGASYHATFTTLGFAAQVTLESARAPLLGQIRALLSAIYLIELVTGVAGTVLLGVLLWRSPQRRLLALLPTAWTLLDFLPRFVPAPVGALVAGGWTNGWFAIFFAAALVAFREEPAPLTPAAR